jgi:hypothetical protein
LTNGLQQRRKSSCVETFFPDPNHRWAALAAGSEQGMEIRIERHADARVGARSSQNLCIVGTAMPISETWVTSHSSWLSNAAVDRGRP